MCIGTGRDLVNRQQTIHVGTDEIERVAKIKYLGVIIDSQLSFKEHAKYICKTIGFKIGFLSRCSGFTSDWTRLTIYNTCILPHFNYCSSILYLLNKNEMDRLQKLQNRGMRLILGCSRLTSIKDMLSTLRWLSVKKYVTFFTLVFVHKIKNDLAPKYLQDMLVYNTNIHNYNTRTNLNFHLQTYRKKSSQNSLFFKGLSEYNDLPVDIKNSSTLNIFKSRLRKY